MAKVMKSYFWQSCFFQGRIKVPLDKIIMIYRVAGLIWKYEIMGIGRAGKFPFFVAVNLTASSQDFQAVS
jgi:hypothetical protein